MPAGFPDTAWSFVPGLKNLADAGHRAAAPLMPSPVNKLLSR